MCGASCKSLNAQWQTNALFHGVSCVCIGTDSESHFFHWHELWVLTVNHKSYFFHWLEMLVRVVKPLAGSENKNSLAHPEMVIGPPLLLVSLRIAQFVKN